VQAAANITLTGARATRDVRDASEIPGSRAAVLEVRIHLPPAASLVRTYFTRQKGRSRNNGFSTGDRWFEYCSLQGESHIKSAGQRSDGECDAADRDRAARGEQELATG